MKKSIFLFLLFYAWTLNAQVGINTETPRGMLEVNSGTAQNQGFVMPQVTQVEDVINTQDVAEKEPPGTMVFDLSRDAVCVKYSEGWNCTSMDGSSSTVLDPSEFTGQQAYIKASNTNIGDNFGISVSVSADGNTMAVGAQSEASNATGINGNQMNNTVLHSGAVYVFVRSGSTWLQQAYVKASNTGSHNVFGRSVSLSADGNTLAVGADGESSNATGIDGDQTDETAPGAGAVYIFERSGTTWSQQSYIKASNSNDYDYFGFSVSLSADGNTLAVGAYGEDSNATGINGTETNNSAYQSGAVYVFERSGTTWSQQAYIKASNTGPEDYFGFRVSLSADGNTLAVGVFLEDSNATGINGNQTDNSASAAGAVYIFVRSGAEWSQQAYIKASNTNALDYFGYSVSLSADGNTLVVGAYGEDSNATGINGSETINGASSSGAVYVFGRSGTTWAQNTYIKASNTNSDDFFGYAISLSADGRTLVVGAHFEDSNATGINQNQTNNTASNSGAVYVFE